MTTTPQLTTAQAEQVSEQLRTAGLPPRGSASTDDRLTCTDPDGTAGRTSGGRTQVTRLPRPQT